jgi:hypothetical protein
LPAVAPTTAASRSFEDEMGIYEHLLERTILTVLVLGGKCPDTATGKAGLRFSYYQGFHDLCAVFFAVHFGDEGPSFFTKGNTSLSLASSLFFGHHLFDIISLLASFISLAYLSLSLFLPLTSSL